MGFFDFLKKEPVTQQTAGRIKSVTIYWNSTISGFASVISPMGILLDLKKIEEDTPLFSQKVRSYMQEYHLKTKRLEKLRPCKSVEELKNFVAKNFKQSAKTDFSMVGSDTIWFLYLIEYGEPDESLKLSDNESKEIKAIIFSQNPLDNKYENPAQEIVDIFKKQSVKAESDNIFDRKLCVVAEQIKDFDKMLLVAHRANVLASEQNVKNFALRLLLEYAWRGIDGWEQYYYCHVNYT